MNDELDFSKEDLERQLEQALESWKQLYDMDDADCDFVREEFWSEIQSLEAAPQILHDIEALFKERHHKLRTYRAEVAAFVEQFYRLDTDDFETQLIQKRKALQTELGLSDRRTDPNAIVKRHRKNLEHYAQTVYALAQQKQSLVFSEDDRAQLERARQTLSPGIAQQIEQNLVDQKRQEYHKKLLDHIAKFKQLPDPEFWKALLVGHWLDERLVQDIHQAIQTPRTLTELAEDNAPVQPEMPSQSFPRLFLEKWKFVPVIAGVGVAVAAIAAFPSLQAPQSLQMRDTLSTASALKAQILQEFAWISTAQKAISQTSVNGDPLIVALKPLQQIRPGSTYQSEAAKLTGEICVKLQGMVTDYFNQGMMPKEGDAIVSQTQPACGQLQTRWLAMKVSWTKRETYLQTATQHLKRDRLKDAITEAKKVLAPDSNPKIPAEQKFISQNQIERANAIIREANARLVPPPMPSPFPVVTDPVTDPGPSYQAPSYGGGGNSTPVQPPPDEPYGGGVKPR
ncbi:MAG: hypothetical protein KME16_00665 [Scytolyngbya sp. HA4215-MV1]|nr:hypothetical protein [Scytolyngbya sp. HA4215-MV1]